MAASGVMFRYLLFSSCLLALHLSSAQDITCESPYVDLGGICYYFSPVGSTGTWVQAREACLRDGALLAILDTEEKNTNVGNHLQDQKNVLGYTVKWIGLTDKEESGTYIWDGTGEPATYTNFYGLSGNNLNCIGMSYHTISDWSDFDCEQSFQYICQKVEVGCQSPFVSIGSGCYLFHNAVVHTWIGAHNYCNRMGKSSLLSIDNEEENSDISMYIATNYGGDTFWVGGYDEDHEGRWYWDDSGNRMSYTSWATGQPNGGKEENCATVDETGWNDEACSGKYYFVCELHY